MCVGWLDQWSKEGGENEFEEREVYGWFCYIVLEYVGFNCGFEITVFDGDPG